MVSIYDIKQKDSDEDQIDLDARGLYCPEPVMLLHNKIRDMLQVLFCDLSQQIHQRSVTCQNFVLFLGHELVSAVEDSGEYVYLIQKKDSNEKQR